MAVSSSSHLLVVAFDFGTTYSGYAFSFRDDPLKVQTNQNWIAGSERLISLKTPTCVLLDPDKNFHSFGFEAENKYADLADRDKHQNWLLFRHFKMLLHNNQKLSRKTMVKDINGNKVEALKIFAMSIRYLRDHFLETLKRQTIGIEDKDILYVLTIPAIWDDSAKQFMREAAIEAGIDTTRLKLALEPEAASMLCQVMTTEAQAALSGAGSRYMVVDLGGGTADITVHEKQQDGTLKEMHKASGGPWGGTCVDNNYIEWLEEIFGKNAMDRFKTEDMTDYFDLLRDFEIKKRTISSELKEPITLKIPTALKEKIDGATDVTCSLEDRLKVLTLLDAVTIRRDKMKTDPEIVRSWFEDPLNEVISHVKLILDEPQMKMVTLILLVGGFGESQYVHDKFKDSFRDKHVIVPAEAGLVVLKGAVRFGHDPTVVSARVMQLSYGISCLAEFDETRHPKDKMFVVEGRRAVGDYFEKFVSVGETVPFGHEVVRPGTLRKDTLSVVRVFCSTDAEPTFTTEPSFKRLGELIIDLPEFGSLEDRDFETTFVFGETELIVKLKILKTGQVFNTSIDCLK